ncbi:Imm1 family immunity protein [Saccharopolyspora phatthalungensis]|uniref:Immunity protein Imm1 n=1 Tax=Saccharopolyspora phatthalungensis TaxID=664693 RepID=A0A840PXM7_9PSEU|nr:Imm1 family immunity protein [Saccharopolyspora phatthalungensis]MBB5152517.1 hypothetical protein [Saccharopolyspora phatthalungensis]
MTTRLELDDGTSLDAADVRETLISQSTRDRAVVYLVHDNEAELVVGFRGDRGVCLWESDDGMVTTGGTNAETIIYGGNEIPFPPGSEIDAATVINAAEEFAVTGARPTGVDWTSYHEAMPVTETTMTPEALQALLGEPDAGR